MIASNWLPGLVTFDDYDGDWTRYVEALYAIFKNEFVDSKPEFMKRRIGLKRHPVEKGKEATFWHFISQGTVEEERLPDLRRCERIRWPRPIIEAAESDKIRFWLNKRNGERRILLAIEDFSYVVVLADRGEFVLPWTAYYVKETHRRRKLEKEFEEFRKDSTKNSWDRSQ